MSVNISTITYMIAYNIYFINPRVYACILWRYIIKISNPRSEDETK